MSKGEKHERRQEIAGSSPADTSTKVKVTVTTDNPSKVSVAKHEVDENTRTEKSKNIVSDTYNKGKEKLSDVKSKMYETIDMKRLMKHAKYCLCDLMNPSLNIERQIPIELLSNAFGLFFLSEIKASMVAGSSMGLGIIIARKPNGEGWTGPCAIGMGGVSIGFQIGMEKTEHIFILRDKEALKPFINNNQFKLGTDASFSVGPLGRDANISLDVNDKGYAAVYSYSMSKGIYVGSSLEGQVIMVRDDCNENYYGKKVSVKDILCDKVDFLPQEEEYLSLIDLIEKYTKNKGQLSQEIFSNEENRNKEEEEYWKSFSGVDSNKQQEIKPEEQQKERNPEEQQKERKPEEQRHEQRSKLQDKPKKSQEEQKSTNDISSGTQDQQEKSTKTFGDKTSNITEKSEQENQSEMEHLNMKQLLNYAYENLENFVNPRLTLEKQIPMKLLNDAFGIIFLTELKASLVVGASLGIGIILARRSTNEGKGWTGPCAVGLGGMSIGFQMGMQKTNHVIVIHDEHVLNTFVTKGVFKIGGDASFSVGPLGRDTNIALNVSDKGAAPVYSYSMAKGAYIGTSLEGHVITIRNDINEEYYGKKVTPNEILLGHVQPLQDEEYNLLCKSLNEYITFKKHQVENYSKTTNMMNESDTVRVVTDTHKEEIVRSDKIQQTK